MAENRHVSIAAGGDVLAEATISTPDDNGEVRVAVAMASGHLPAGARQRMADAIHETVINDHADRLTASVPLGDAELVDGIRQHLDDPELRAAGATSIIEGDISDR
jgi:hypothetical protein